MAKRNTVPRKALFRAALAIKQTTAGQWARDKGVSESLVSLVLSGYRPGSPLSEEIDAYIAEGMAELKALAS